MEEAIDKEASLEISLFGTFLVRIDGVTPPSARSRKVSWLLALLVLRQGGAVERDWLAATLWPESLESQALFNLRQTLPHLRRLLGTAASRLHAPTSHSLALDLTGATVDMIAFDAAILRADPASLQEAVTLYRGPLLEGCLEEWCLPERRRREEEYLNALEFLAERALTEGDPTAAIGLWRKVIGIDPLREQAQRGLMQAFTACGEVATAVQVYRDLRLFLHQNLQTEPDPETTALFEQIREQARQRSRIAPDPAVPASAPSSRRRLPVPLTNLIGREQEIASIRATLQSARLVTLTGPGGVGKTRLAIAVGQETQNVYDGGACFVDLAAMVDPSLLPASVAAALGVRPDPQRTLLAVLQDYLEPQQMLLILDNCEHLIEACASLAAALLGAAPQLRLLATSRQILGLTGEIARPIPPLPLPASALPTKEIPGKEWVSLLHEYEAIQLFLERAHQASSTFQLTPQNATAVARICTRLDGIPLAIELAAAQTRALAVERIDARLDVGLALLTGGDRTVALRHQTLRATLDWSYALLTEPERILLRRLTVFAGGWDLEAAESVCFDATIPAAAVFPLLTRLIDQSLVVVQPRGEERGYRLLETIRHYGQERLREVEEETMLRARHRDYFLELVEEAAPKLSGPEQVAWMGRLETEYDNLRSALVWSVAQGEAEAGQRICGVLQEFWAMRGFIEEGRNWCTAVLALEGGAASTPVRAKALNGAARMAVLGGDLTAAQDYLEEGLAIERVNGNQGGIAKHLGNLGNVACERGDYASAQAYFEEGLTLDRAIDNRAGCASMLNNLGNVSIYSGDYAAAKTYYEASLRIERELGNPLGIARSLHNLGNITYHQADYVASRGHYAESLALLQEIGATLNIASALSNLGNVCRQEGDATSAQHYYEQALAIQQQSGDREAMARTLNNLGNAVFNQDRYSEARSFFEQGLRIFQEIENRPGIAAALNNLGNLNFTLGDYAAAKDYYAQSMTLLRELGERYSIVVSLSAFAGLAIAGIETNTPPSASSDLKSPADADPARAVRLWSASQALCEQIGATRPPEEQERQDQKKASVRRRLSDAEWDAAWSEGQAFSLEQAIDYALQA